MSHETPDADKYQSPGMFLSWREVWQILPITLAICGLVWFALAMVILVLS